MTTKPKTIYTSLPVAYCVVPHCGKPQRRTRCGPCRNCVRLHNKYGIPMAGFIPVTTLSKMAKVLIKDEGLNAGDISEALKIARGTRHRQGPWEQRPPWRYTPIRMGTTTKKRPHLLIGRRLEPNIQSLVSALIHYVLIEEVLEAGSQYARVLAGKTFFATRGLYCAKGQTPEVPEGKPKALLLDNRHFGIIGTVALKACKRAGLDVKDRDLRTKILMMYLNGREAGEYRHPQYPPRAAIRSAKVGDHPFDFLIPSKPWVDPAIRGKTYRAGGTIRGKPVELLPMPPHILWRHLHPEYRIKPKPKVLERNLRQPGDTSWIFNNNNKR